MNAAHLNILIQLLRIHIWELVWPNSWIDDTTMAILHFLPIIISNCIWSNYISVPEALLSCTILFRCIRFYIWCQEGNPNYVRSIKICAAFPRNEAFGFFFVEDNNQMCNIRKRNSTLSDLGHQLYFCWRTILPPYVAPIILDNWLASLQNVDKAYDKKHNVFNRIY